MPFYRLDTSLWTTDRTSRRRLLSKPHLFTFPDTLPAGGYVDFSLTLGPLETYTKTIGGTSRFLIMFSDRPIELTVIDDQMVPVTETFSNLRMVAVEKTTTQITVTNTSTTLTAAVSLAYEFAPSV